MIAYGPLACGADILVAEAILALGGELHVVLPFAEEDFLRTSVRVGGAEWEARYHAARDAAASVTFATQMQYVDDDEQFAYCSKLVMGLAQLRAGIMHAEAFQLAVWDGRPGQRGCGHGGRLRRMGAPGRRKPASFRSRRTVRRWMPWRSPRAPSRPHWALRSMLFADFAGFSRLDEDCLSQFLEVVMGRIATVLDRHADAVLTRNSWGDAIYAVITSPAQAAEIALEIQSELDPAVCCRKLAFRRKAECASACTMGRSSNISTPFRARGRFYGTEVTVAARIEPRVPVGAIYTTQPFAAMIESDRNNYHFEYVGKMDLAKNYGVRILYRLSTSGNA